MQLELGFWPPGTLKEAVDKHLADQTDGLATATVKEYGERAEWLLKVLGRDCSLEMITIQRLQEIVRYYGPKGKGLKQVTLKKRISFLTAALHYAAARGHIDPIRVPDMKWLKLRDDGEHRTTFYTVAQFEHFRTQLGGDRYEFPSRGTRGMQSPEKAGRYQLAGDIIFWTGHHTADVQKMLWTHLDLDYVWIDHLGAEMARGRYFRINSKNEKRRVDPAWFPMEPEFRELLVALQERYGRKSEFADPTAVVGRISGLGKAMAAAARKAGLPEASPIDLRRSFATMLASRGYPNDYIRLAMGHLGEVTVDIKGAVAKVKTARPSTLTRHYLRPSPELMTAVVMGRENK